MNHRQPVSVGVDLGGTSVRVGLYDDSMRSLEGHSMPTRVADGPQSTVDEIAASILRLLRREGGDGYSYEAIGVGIGSPGPINLHTGVLGLLPNLPGWNDFPLRDALEKATGLPVTLESDANAAAIAEWKLGAGRATGLDSMAMITLGTGVGSGLILKGHVWHGMFGMGGEVGHATVEPGGLLCGCGSRGCLEAYASANGLIRLARTAASEPDASAAMQELGRSAAMTPLAVALLAGDGDAAAQRAFARLGTYLGIGIANLINTLDLPMIVIGGGMASAWSLFAPAMFEAVREHSVVYRLVEPTQRETLEENRTFIRPAVLGPPAGLMGAALLPLLAQAANAGSIALDAPQEPLRGSRDLISKEVLFTEPLR